MLPPMPISKCCFAPINYEEDEMAPILAAPYPVYYYRQMKCICTKCGKECELISDIIKKDYYAEENAKVSEKAD